MSDEYSIPSFFSDDPRTGALTYQQLQARRAVALALASRNRPYPKTIGEGLTALGEGLGEGFANDRLARAEAAQSQYDAGATKSLMGGTATPRGGASIEGDPNAAVADAAETKQPLTPAQASQQPQMPIEEWLHRVARNESGGAKDAYSLVGERSRRGDYPYGKYQVMGENVPVWTKQYLGKEMTPQEFLADKDAQEQVARGRGSEYLAKYGPEGAAAAWFAGEKGMNDPNRKDTLGTHVAEYRRRFNIPVVSRDQVVASAARAPVDPENAAPTQVASLGGGMPTPDTAPDPREAVAQSLAGQPPQQQVAQAAPLPTTPPAVSRPQIAPSTAATLAERPVPAGPEPELRTFIEGNPQLKQQMDNARRIALDPRASPHIQAQAQAVYTELEKRANDAFSKQWTVWHERASKEDAFRLEAEARQRARETHDVTMKEAPYKLEQARKQAEPTVREVDGRLMERDADSGKWSDVTPGGSLPTLTEAQGKMLGFYQRAKWAMHNLGEGKELTDFWNWHASGMPVIGNYATNAKFQRQLQAANELAAVQLRLETGAAAPPAELKNVVDRFVPKPGDQPELHLQKEQQRNALVKSYADQMGSKGQAYVDKFNREFELDKKEYDKKQNALMPPVRITDPDQLELVPSGRRWIAPDGKIKIKP